MPSHTQSGFSYVMVLAAVVILGIVAEAAHLTTWHILQRDREAELMFRGDAYRRAIQSYYEAAAPVYIYPRALDDLLKDPRFAGKRHIRQLYSDPMGEDEKKEWLLIRSPDGGVSGVSSASKKEPLKKTNFPREFEKFAGTGTYAEWLFEFVPATNVLNPHPPNTSAQSVGSPVFK
jgi:type II secretory pathway pseudopilin PulG